MKLIIKGSVIMVGLLLSLPAPLLAAAKQGEKSIEEELRFKAGDETGNEVKALKTELMVMRSEKKALEQLERLKRRYKGTRMEAEILFRLGEIYMRRARTERFFEVHKDSSQVANFAPAMVRDASEVKQIRKAIAIYLDLEARFPRFRARDLVVFNTAYAYQQVGDDKKAEAEFQKLIAQHPKSPLVPDSLLSLGEIYYGRRSFAIATESFLKLRDYPDARAYPYGIYKAAWCRYNMQDENGGILLLEQVIAYGHEKAKAGQVSAKLDLRKEALGDLALFYSDTRKAEDAVAYFTKQAGDLDAVPVVLRLVEFYKRHSKYKEVDIVLRGILEKLPDSTAIALVHEELIWNADHLKRRDLAVQQLEILDRMCDGMGKKQPGHAECDAKVIEVSKKLGAKLHAIWKRERTAELADLALRSYQLHLSNQTDAGKQSHDVAQVRYAYADLLFSRNRFREAIIEYSNVELASKDAGKSGGFDLMQTDPKLAVEASYGAVVSLERAVGDEKWSDADEVQFDKLASAYLKKAPNGPYALDLRFKKAFIAYEKEKYDKAAPDFKLIGWSKDNTTHPKVLKAQDLYLDILNIKKDYKTLKEAAQALLANGLAKGREDHLAKIRREAWFAEVGEVESRGEHQTAVSMYRAFAVESKGSALGARAWWNASQILFKTGDAAGGAAMCSEMYSMFPGAENSKTCLLQAAQTFESIARLDLAAPVLLTLAELEPDKKMHWKETATDFLALSGDRVAKDRALGQYLKFAEEGKADARLPYFEKAAVLAKELRDDKMSSQIRGKIESLGLEPAASRFALEEAESTYKGGDSTKAFSLTKRLVGRESALKDAKYIPAGARFIQARILEDEYRQQSVKARVDKIGIVLAIKTEKLEKAQKAFQAAGKMGDPGVAVKSLVKLADLYLDYSKVVKGMTLPADVPAADQKAFQKEIEQIVLPMEEKGIEALSQAIEASKKAGTLDGTTGRLQEKLDAVNMRSSGVPAVEVEALPRLGPTFERRSVGLSTGGLK